MQRVVNLHVLQRRVHRYCGHLDLVDHLFTDGPVQRRHQGLRQGVNTDPVGHPDLRDVSGSVEAAIRRQRPVLLQLNLVAPARLAGEIGVEADMVIDRRALARIDRCVEHETHGAAAPGRRCIDVIGRSQSHPTDRNCRRGNAALIELVCQYVGDLDTVSRGQAVITGRQPEVHHIGGNIDLVRIGQGTGADTTATELNLADRPHSRLPDVNPRRGRQTRRVAPRIGEFRHVVAQNGRVKGHPQRRCSGNDLCNIADHQGVSRSIIVARRVGDVAELPAQGAGGAGRRLGGNTVSKGAAPRGGGDVHQTGVGQTRRERILKYNVPRREFLQIQRQFIGHGVADANDRNAGAGRCLGIGVIDHRFDKGGVIDRADDDLGRTGAIIVEEINGRAAGTGALSRTPGTEGGPIDIDAVSDGAERGVHHRHLIGQHQRLADRDVEGDVTVLAPPDHDAAGEGGWIDDKAGDSDAVDLRDGGVREQRDVRRQDVDHVAGKGGGAATIGQGEHIFEDVTNRGRNGDLFARGRDKPHGLGGGEDGFDHGHVGGAPRAADRLRARL